jgi:hypothetical protein
MNPLDPTNEATKQGENNNLFNTKWNPTEKKTSLYNHRNTDIDPPQKKKKLSWHEWAKQGQNKRERQKLKEQKNGAW